MKSDSVLAKPLTDGRWLIQGDACYAIIESDGKHQTYAKKGAPVQESFRIIVKALSEWCARTIPSGPKSP